MTSIPELIDGHLTLEMKSLDRLYLNGHISGLATPGGLVTFMRVQLDKPIPSPVLPGQVSEKLRDAAQEKAEAFSRDKTVYVNHRYFYVDDKDFSPLFTEVCSYAR